MTQISTSVKATPVSITGPVITCMMPSTVRALRVSPGSFVKQVGVLLTWSREMSSAILNDVTSAAKTHSKALVAAEIPKKMCLIL